MNYDTFGIEIQADFWEVNPELLNDIKLLREISKCAISEAGATYVNMIEKKFEPFGVTILILLQESHFALHSYPEKGFIALSCYTCGKQCDPEKAIDFMYSALSPARIVKQKTIRGVIPR
jgi:S-adenosylmethionine decarboxylase